MNKAYIPVYLLSYNGIIIYKKFLNSRKNDKKTEQDTGRKSNRPGTNLLLQCSDTQNETIHKGIKKLYKINPKKVRNRALAFSRLQKSQKGLFFYTITFPEGISDKLANKCWNIALTRLRKENLIQDYLYVCERQKNGTIHYHFLTNDRFYVRDLNDFIKASLLNLSHKKLIRYDAANVRKYNGVDIAKNRVTRQVTNFAGHKNSKKLIGYITKYISKGSEKFEVLPFHSSHSISNLTHKITVDEFLCQEAFQVFDPKNFFPKRITSDFFTWIGFSDNVNPQVFKFLDAKNEEIYRNQNLSSP